MIFLGYLFIYQIEKNTWTQESHDIIKMGDKNKKSNTTTTSATTTPPHTSKSNEVNNTKSTLKNQLK